MNALIRVDSTGTLLFNAISLLPNMTPEIAESFKIPGTRGTLITEVFRGTPADRGGVKPGDVLVAVDGKAVVDSASMLNLIAALKPGSETTLRLMREAKAVELRVTVGKRPPKPVRKE